MTPVRMMIPFMSVLHQPVTQNNQAPQEQGKTNQEEKGVQVGHGFPLNQHYFTASLIKPAARNALFVSRINQGLAKKRDLMCLEISF
jgi:hypothetical protein